jgi:NitT/TauT family transport system substrate-binding protein
MPSRPCRRGISAWLLTAALTFVSVGTAAAQTPPAPAPAANLTVRLTSKLSAAHTPLLVALERGYYAAEGLQVDISDANIASAMQVIAGGAEKIGYGSAVRIAEAVSAGLPVIMVSVYIPKMPLALVAHADVALQSPKDLEGRRLGLDPNELFASTLIPFAKINEVALSKVMTVAAQPSTREAQFAAREFDVLPVVTYDDLAALEKRIGTKLNVLKVADYDLVLLDQGLFVNQEFAKQQPETIRKLLRAVGKGYADAIKDPAAATEIAAKHLTGLERDIIEAQVRALIAASPVPTEKPLGWQEEAQWRGNVDLLKAVGRIKEIKEPGLYFTNDFLQ